MPAKYRPSKNRRTRKKEEQEMIKQPLTREQRIEMEIREIMQIIECAKWLCKEKIDQLPSVPNIDELHTRLLRGTSTGR
jgi:DNA mismatch repair ATPase MutS